MKDFDLGKFGAPLAIFAAIIAIWYYLSGRNQPTQAIVNNPATNVPGVGQQLPGLTQVLYQPGYGGGVGGPPQPAPSIAATVAAGNNPTSTTGAAPQNTIPSYLTYNFGPEFAFSKLPMAAYMADQEMMKGPGGCGCKGSCGGGCNTSCVPNCDLTNSRFPDGRGGCLTSKPPLKLARKVSKNLAAYTVFDSIVQRNQVSYLNSPA